MSGAQQKGNCIENGRLAYITPAEDYVDTRFWQPDQFFDSSKSLNADSLDHRDFGVSSWCHGRFMPA